MNIKNAVRITQRLHKFWNKLYHKNIHSIDSLSQIWQIVYRSFLQMIKTNKTPLKNRKLRKIRHQPKLPSLLLTGQRASAVNLAELVSITLSLNQTHRKSRMTVTGFSRTFICSSQFIKYFLKNLWKNITSRWRQDYSFTLRKHTSLISPTSSRTSSFKASKMMATIMREAVANQSHNGLTKTSTSRPPNNTASTTSWGRKLKQDSLNFSNVSTRTL